MTAVDAVRSAYGGSRPVAPDVVKVQLPAASTSLATPLLSVAPCSVAVPFVAITVTPASAVDPPRTVTGTGSRVSRTPTAVLLPAVVVVVDVAAW